jgi:hypothetical protein
MSSIHIDPPLWKSLALQLRGLAATVSHAPLASQDRHLLDLVQIGALDLAADRGTLDVVGVQHARHLYINAEQRLAGNDLQIVDAGITYVQR